MEKKTDTTVSILAEIAAYGEFLPGSVRKTWEKRTSRKTGKVKRYEAQPIYTYTDSATGKQKSKRIPKEAFNSVKELTTKYKGLKKLMQRFEAAAVAENLDDGSKKTPRVERWRPLCEHRPRHRRVPRQAGGGVGFRSRREEGAGVLA